MAFSFFFFIVWVEKRTEVEETESNPCRLLEKIAISLLHLKEKPKAKIFTCLAHAKLMVVSLPTLFSK